MIEGAIANRCDIVIEGVIEGAIATRYNIVIDSAITTRQGRGREVNE